MRPDKQMPNKRCPKLLLTERNCTSTERSLLDRFIWIIHLEYSVGKKSSGHQLVCRSNVNLADAVIKRSQCLFSDLLQFAMEKCTSTHVLSVLLPRLLAF